MAGNVMEWLATAETAPQAWEPRKDFTSSEGIQITWAGYFDDSEHLCCGARSGGDPIGRYYYQGFRVLWSLALIG